MYEAFYRWCKHHNKELSFDGYAAMESFLKQVLLEKKNQQFNEFKVTYLCFIVLIVLCHIWWFY